MPCTCAPLATRSMTGYVSEFVTMSDLASELESVIVLAFFVGGSSLLIKIWISWGSRAPNIVSVTHPVKFEIIQIEI